MAHRRANYIMMRGRRRRRDHAERHQQHCEKHKHLTDQSDHAYFNKSISMLPQREAAPAQ
jgi:hypothetical protein